MIGFEFKDRYDIEDLIKIVRILRDENGCPWDKEQTHESIRMNLVEEAYETIEAIDCKNPDMLIEELGDVLLQVVFHAQIENEKNSFCFDDVANDICKKLIIRHPHVFGEVSVSSTDDVLKNWDSIKKDTKNQKTYTDTLKSIPKVFPALMRAQKLCKRANTAGLDLSGISLSEKVLQFENDLSSNDKDKLSASLGEVMFFAANAARKLELDAEEVLGLANDRFLASFEKLESDIASNGEDMKDIGKDKLLKLWNEIYQA